MIKTSKRFMALLLSILMIMSMAGCKEPEATPYTPSISPSQSTAVVEPPTTAEPVTEKVDPTSVSLVAVGDILLHVGANIPAVQADGSYNYDYLFKHVTDKIQAADIAVVNQEVILGGRELGIQGYPNFNAAQEVGDALVKAGFNVVLHATNHTFDQGVKGITNTINYWKTAHPDMTYLGIHDSKEDSDKVKVMEVNGIKIAMLNYTYGLNGYDLPAGQEYLVDMLDSKETIAADIAKAKELADFVVVYPHWGTEYNLSVDNSQKDWAKFFADNGVNLVIGTHPHCLEPVEWVQGNSGNKMLVYYSLGNYISIQYRNISMLGGMSKVTITKDSSGTYISDYNMDFLVTHYIPGRAEVTTYMLNDYTNELAAQHAINTEPYSGDKAEFYKSVNAQYPFTVEGLKQLAKDVCPDLAK